MKYEDKLKMLHEMITAGYQHCFERDDLLAHIERGGEIQHPVITEALFKFDEIEQQKPKNAYLRDTIRDDFEWWMVNHTDETPSLNYNPYAECRHEVWWLIWYGLALANGPSQLGNVQ